MMRNVLLAVAALLVSCTYANGGNSGAHTNNWAVLVDTSRFWFNYRHAANVLSIYHSVKRLGIPDNQIILMVADEMACNSRNPMPGTIFNSAHRQLNVYGEDAQIDYRGYEVNVENFVRLLLGRLPAGTARSKQLDTDENSNIFIYLTGHGGDGFLKFQDSEEISSVELADVIEQMRQRRRYHEIFLMVDTCQAESMYKQLYSPNVVAFTSSLIGEDSLSHHSDPRIGVFVIDRFTFYALQFLEAMQPDSRRTLADFFYMCPRDRCGSTTNYRIDLYGKDPSRVLLTEFFGSSRLFDFATATQRVHLANRTVEEPPFAATAAPLSSDWQTVEQMPYV